MSSADPPNFVFHITPCNTQFKGLNIGHVHSPSDPEPEVESNNMARRSVGQWVVLLDSDGNEVGPIYPGGATAMIHGSVNSANQAAVATLTPASGKTAYISGFEVSGGGSTAGLAVGVTVAGLLNGTRTYAYVFEIGPLVGNKPLIVQFMPPLLASAIDTAIVVTCPASGAGGTANTVNAHGFYR